MNSYRIVIAPLAKVNIRKAHDWLKSADSTHAAKWLTGISGNWQPS